MPCNRTLAPPPIQPLNDSAAFTVAASQKLGRMGSLSGTADENYSSSSSSTPKEKWECTRDTDCASSEKCNMSTNKCVSICSLASCSGSTPYCQAQEPHNYACRQCLSNSHCPAGKQCSSYSCTNCPRGSTCTCPSGQVADGAGGCFNPCSPNPCGSTTPTCSSSGANYSCKCTSTSCPTGKTCNGTSCVNCTRGSSCNCPSGKVADGYGGCFDPCNPNYCGSSTPVCSSSGANYSCACTESSCPAGKKCSSGSCVNCSEGESCNCPVGQAANGSGSCQTVDRNADCVKYCGSGFVYDRPGALYGGTERVCTKYPYSCGYNCTTGWDIWYANNPYTCQQAIQTPPNDDNAMCKQICGSGFVYDRPGAKFGGKEKVCTRYPKSCGYNCTTGWDIVYGTGVDQPYTCQTAIQR